MKTVRVCGGGTYAGGGIGRRAGGKRGAHNGLQLMGNADIIAECAMSGDKFIFIPGISRREKGDCLLMLE